VNCGLKRGGVLAPDRKRNPAPPCPRKSLRQRAHIGCFTPAYLLIAGEEMLLIAARATRRNY
jgi:hypothetical protein